MLKPWQAGLLAFIGSAILFLGLPLPPTITIREQVLVLVVFQGIATGLAMLIAWLRMRRNNTPRHLDIVSRRKKRGRLRIVHSRH